MKKVLTAVVAGAIALGSTQAVFANSSGSWYGSKDYDASKTQYGCKSGWYGSKCDHKWSYKDGKWGYWRTGGDGKW